MDEEEIELKQQLKRLKDEELTRRKSGLSDRRERRNKEQAKPSAIYISNLPTGHIDSEQLLDEFSRYGTIKKDQDGKRKCKLYRTASGELKGDALIIYARCESVPMAIEMMNGYEFEGSIIKVQVAEFQNNKKRPNHDDGDSENTSPPIKIQKQSSMNKSDLDEGKSATPNGEYYNGRNKESRTIKIANIFGIYDELSEEELVDIESDLKDGCLSFGPIENIIIHPELGESTVVFMKDADALNCCKKMNGRYFDGRQLLAYMLDEEDISQPSDGENYVLEDNLIE